MSVVVVSPTSSITGRTRLYKVCRILADRGVGVTHLGWHRSEVDSIEESPEIILDKKRILLSGGGYGGAKNKILYVLWMIKVFCALLFMRRSCIWALGLETALPVMLASLIRGHRFVFDDADRFLLIFKFPSFLYKMFKFFEVATSRSSVLHIVPSVERYDYISDKFFQLYNLPDAASLERAKNVPLDRDLLDSVRGKVVVYVNGWLSNTRGAEFVKDFCENIISYRLQDQVFLIFAGKYDSDVFRSCLSFPFVRDFGEVEYERALSLYRVSDFVVTLYDPALEINRYAISNKWGDALYFGVRPVVNFEVKTAAFMESILLRVDYRDSILLLDAVREAKNSRTPLSEADFSSVIGELVSFDEGVHFALSKLLEN